MGILALEPHPRLAAPDSPPGLVSPSSSSYSSRPSPPAEKLWNSRFGPVSPPMSNYEQSSADMAAAGSAADDGTGRKGSTQSAPRQSLPPLSSLFPSVRPLHSPMSDRPGGYPATSPLDRPHFSTSHGDRSYSSSYFPPQDNPAVSQPRSTYEPRYDHHMQALSSLSRSLSGPGSPRYREPEHLRRDSRPDFGSSGKWSMQHEAGKHEYSLVSRESQQAPRGHFDRPSYQYTSPTDAGPSYRDQRPPSGSGLMQASTAASATASEGIPSKDGLGPKIWTGSQFLPRFVRAAEVPGEGMCYFYDDGSHCKTVIDGEAVNAHWGVTKAGKPRKRLAIACVTCREKKIKCDPDYPRCVQCEKFSRQCKFKNAPRGGHNTSPSTPPAEPEELRRLGGPMVPNDMHRTGSVSSAPVSPRTTLRQTSAEPPMPHKRMRLGYESYPPTMAGEPMALSRPPDVSKASISWQPRQSIELPRIHEDVLGRAWQADPYVSDPESISSVISSFFVHNDSTLALRFLPETAFKSWVFGNAHKKSPEDLMLIYSILAIGVALSGASLTFAHEYAQVANYAQQRAAPGLQLVQARLLLALYYMATSRTTEACDMTSAAISAAASLQLNLELDRSIEASLEVFPYGLKKAGYEESRRRTYWACYVLERLNGLFPNRPGILDDNDIFIRLPCETECFEEQQVSDAPYFPGLSRVLGKSNRPLSLWAYLVQLVSQWAHVMTEAYRNAQGLRGDSGPSGSSREEPDDWHEPHAERLARGLGHWRESLPEKFTYGRDNMDLAAQDGTLSTFLTIHLLYHHGMVKIHRNSQPPRRLSPVLRMQYMERIREEATRALDIVGALEALLQSRRTPISSPPPFMSHVILEAADVLTAEGSLGDVSVLLERLAVASDVVKAASTIWEESRAHQAALERRSIALQLLRDCQPGETPFVGGQVFVNEDQSELPPGRCWRMDDAMDTTFLRTFDLVYARS